MMLDANIKEYFEFYKDDINDEEINKLLDYFNCSEFLGSSSDRVDYYLGDKKILSTFGSNSTYKKINTNKYQKALLPFVDEFDKKYYLQRIKMFKVRLK